MLPKISYWTRIINIIVQSYLSNTTICIVWNEDIEFELQPVPSYNSSPYAVVNIEKTNLAQSFVSNVISFAAAHEQLVNNGVIFDDFVEKLTVSINASHCESFLVFEADIPAFVTAFVNASVYSTWRSMRNRFVFAFRSNATKSTDNYFQHYFFQDHASILLVEQMDYQSPYFNLKTNKYVGSCATRPDNMYILDHYNAESNKFQFCANLFPDKTRNLQGRELVLAALNYKPAIVLKNVSNLESSDPSKAATTYYLDGTEAQILLTFCEKYNCTIKIDTSEADDWGVIYKNATGIGALGMVAKRKAHIGMGAMYAWPSAYMSLDMSNYLARSGVTCLVPVPRRLTSWTLPLDPFQMNLWAGITVCLVIEILGLMCFRKSQHILHPENSSWQSSFLYGLATTLKLFISQSNSDHSKSMSLRLFLFSCFVNDILVSSIYGGGLASILTVPSFEEAADTVERLAAYNLKWAGNSEAWVSILRGVGDVKIKAILKNYFIYTDEELFVKFGTEHMGFVLERLSYGHIATEDYVSPKYIDRYKIMQDDIYFQYTVTFVPRLWPLLGRFNNLINAWHSSGLDIFCEWRVVAENLNSYVQKTIASSMFGDYEDMGPVKLGMTNFAGILLVWFLGTMLSVLIFLSELTYKKCFNNE